jgi:hypothetical protein
MFIVSPSSVSDMTIQIGWPFSRNFGGQYEHVAILDHARNI